MTNQLNYDPTKEPGEIARLQGDIRTYGYLASDRFISEAITECEKALQAEGE